jgi:hypothetical protein
MYICICNIHAVDVFLSFLDQLTDYQLFRKGSVPCCWTVSLLVNCITFSILNETLITLQSLILCRVDPLLDNVQEINFFYWFIANLQSTPSFTIRVISKWFKVWRLVSGTIHQWFSVKLHFIKKVSWPDSRVFFLLLKYFSPKHSDWYLEHHGMFQIKLYMKI